ncbi:putative Ig domain-containing protein [Staphylococcus caprae]
MKNKQGFLPNVLNKYAIRKFTVGTASLLIGATLVFGVGGVARADEIDNATSQNGNSTKDKSEPVDVEELSNSDNTTNQSVKETSDKTSNQTNENQSLAQEKNTTELKTNETPSSEPVTNEKTSEESKSDVSDNKTTNDNNKANETVKDSQQQTKEETNESTKATENNKDTTERKDNISEESVNTDSTKENTSEKSTDNNKSSNQTTEQSKDTDSTSSSKTTDKSTDTDITSSKTSEQNSNIDSTSSKSNTSNETTETNAVGSSTSATTPSEDTTKIESKKESSIPLSDNKTSLTNQVTATTTTRNNNKRFRVLVATKDTKAKTYTKPSNPNYAYLLNDLGYDATTIKDNSGLRYAGVSQLQNDTGNVIKLNLTNWIENNDLIDGGKVNFSFSQSDFYSQIQNITINGVYMTTTNNGQNWTAPINGKTVEGTEGIVTNNEVLITLKNSQTIASLGYSNSKPVYLTHTWTTNTGAIAGESVQVTTIAPNIYSKAPQTTQSSGFTSGKVVNRIRYDSSDNSIKSIHAFKPDENFLQTDYNWVLYIKEQVNKDLIPYIDPSSVKIYVSDVKGDPISSSRFVNGTLSSDGMFDSSTIDEISIKNTNTLMHRNDARTSLDRNIFYGTLGQSRSYTIQYKLKSGYTLDSIASQISDRETFQSWIETDYLDTTDNGEPNKRLLGSYATSYIDMIDRIAPVAPKASNITTQDTAIKGTAEANTTITLNFSDGRTLSGTADSTGNFSVSVPSGFVLTGKETISITSTDKGSNVSPAITITVTDTTPPTVTAINDKTQEVNSVLNNININASDNSGDTVINTVSGLPSGVTFNASTNTISGTPTKVGSYPITVTSKDTNSNTTTTTFTIKVVDTTPPEVKIIADQTKEVNTSIDSINVVATDNSGLAVGNTVSGLPNGVSFDSNTNTISGTPTKVGSYPITVTTTDASGNVTKTTFTIKVVDTISPVVTSIADQSNEVNTAIDSITIEATDNSGLAVSNTVSGLPNGVTFDSNTNTISGTPTKVGSYLITVTTTDAEGNKTETNFTIKVVDTTKPTVTSIKDQTKEVNTAIDSITIEATDNSGLAVSNTVSGLPNGVSFDSETNTISGTPTKVGSYPIVITTTDASGNETTTSFTIKVVDTTKPTVTSIEDQTKEVNTPIDSITIEATDNSGQAVTNKVSGLPDGVSFDSATNTISGTPTKVGSYPIVVTTTDESGNETTTKFTIQVVDTIKPMVTSIEDQTKEVNTPVDSITIEATDNSGLAVSNKVSGLPEGVSFDSETNTISGTPTKVGSYPITVTTTDASGNETTTSFTIEVVDTTKPTVTSIKDQTKEVNTAIDSITIEATDNSGLAVTNKVSGLPDGVSFDSATNTISGTPTKVGSYPITVTTTDAEGNATTTSFTIKVVDTTKPTVTAIKDQTKEVNTAIDTITIEAKDNSGQAVTNKVSGLPAGVEFDSETNTISGTPTKVGSYPITVTTTDAEGNKTTTNFTIKVVDTIKPTVTSIKDQTKEVNTAIDSITIEATDNSGQAVTNKVSGLPEGVSFDSATNTISGTPTKVGSYPITVTTTDASGNKTETTFTIEVVDKTAPMVTSIKDQTKEVSTSIDSIKIEATDNSGQSVTNKVSGLPAGVSFDSETNTISGTPTKVGSYPIVVTTTDESGNETTTKFTIQVVDTIKPMVTSIEDQTKEVNTPIDSITIEATDNSGQAVTNKVSGLPEGVSFDSATNTISGTPTKVGSYPIVVTTTDAEGNKTTTNFTIKVVDTTKPTVTAIKDQTKEVNTSIDSITVEATDNSGQAVTNKVSGLPEGVSFDSVTNTISGTPTKVGSYPIVVTTTDASGNKTETKFTIEVVDTTKPTVTSIADQTKEVNTSIDSIKIESTDNSGQAVTNEVSGLPDGVSFDSETNTISGTPTKVGSYPIVVTTTDASGNKTETKFTIEVVDTTKPTVTSIANQTKEVNTAIDSITIEAKDNSGQDVTNKVSGLPDGVSFDSVTNTISGTPTKVGSYPITVTTTDASGNEMTTNFTIQVIDTIKPVVTSIADQTKEVNTSIDSIKIEATDNSGQSVINKVSGLPDGVTFDSETNTIIGTPTKVGSYPITVITTDAEGNTTTTNFTIKVVDTTSPVVTSIEDQTKEINTSIDPIKIEATDNSAQAVTNKVSGLPEGVNFDSETNTISGTPTKVGSYPIVVTTTDASGNKTETTFTIEVVDKTAPKVTAIENQTQEVNTPIDSIKIEATDNSGQSVTNKVSGLPEGVSFDSETNTISGTPTKVGSYPITVITTDAEGNKTETTFTIEVVDETAPTVTAIKDQTKEVNTPIDSIKIEATDNSGQTVTNKVIGLPEGVSFDSETNTISGTPTKVGSYPITVTTTDASGNETKTSFIIEVVDTIKPTVTSIGNQTKEVNTAIDSIKIEATDNSGQAVTNKVIGLPEGVTFDSETNTISGTPTKVGNYPITVTTTDATGNETTTSFTIEVVDKTAPTVSSIANQTKEVNTSIDSIKIEATDNSGQSVTNKVSGLPAGVSFDSETNTISGTPTKVGSYPIVVTTTDESGNETTTKFTIQVVDTTKPVVTSIANQTKEVNTPIDSITIEATDNSGQAVTNKVSGLPAGVSFDSETNTISGTPTKVGNYPITVTTTDAEGNATTTSFTIKVVDTTKPMVTSIKDQTKEVNTAIDSIKIESTDNSGQAVTNKVSGLPAGVSFDGETNTISGTPTKVGNYPITVTTTDAEGNATTTNFTIKVVDTTKPTVTSIENQTKEINTSIDKITIEATDNSGQAVTNKVSGLPEGVNFDGETNTISGTPTKVGNYPITVTTTDATGNETITNFTIKVVDTTKPMVTSIKDQTKEVNTSIDSIKIEATDNSGQPVTNKVSGLPEGVSFDSETNTISGTPTKVGSYPIVVTTTDASGNETETKFTIKVIDTTKPVVTSIANQTKEVNTPIDSITIEATDNSGQAVTNKVSGLPEGVSFDSVTNTISGMPTKVGSYPIVVTTTDASGNKTETKFTIEVVDTIKPMVTSIEDQTKEVNTPVDSITIEATDNSGLAVSNKVSGLPEGVSFDSATNTISGTPTKVGSYPITVTTTDAEGNATTTNFTIKVVDTTKPTVTSIKDQSKEVNTSIDPIKIEATDNSGQAVTNKVSGLPEGVSFDSETNTISGTPTKVGSYPIIVRTTDAEGNATTTSFTIKVVDTTKPTVATIKDQTKEVNTAIDSITIDASDNSGQAVTNKVSGLPAGVSFDSATNTISGMPTKVGSYPITVTTTDAEGNATTTNFTIKVVDTTKPTVTAIKDQTKEVNTSIDPIKIEATDNSGQVVTNKVSGLPAGVSFDSETNTISGTPTKVGSYPITVTTTDASGNKIETTFTIEVVDKTAPTVTSIKDQTKEVNTPIDSITIDASDNSGQVVTNKVSGLPEGVSFDSETNTISGTPTKVGSYPITVTTTDASGNKIETTFTIEVVDKTAPMVTSIKDQTKEVNTSIDPIKIEAKDNSGQAVTNKVSGLPEGVNFDSETNTISGTPTKVGSYPIVVTTTDASGNKTETKFTIEVVDKTAPTVSSIENQTIEVNTSIDLIKIEATDNSGQVVTNKVNGLPEGVSFDSETNTISGTPTKVGSYPITVTTTDAEGNATTTNFTIKVVDTTKPTVTAIKDQTKEVNTSIDSIKIEATDNSGQAVTNKVSGLPEGISFNSDTNTISGTPTKVGNYPITVTTTDASGNKTETKFTIEVVDTTKPTVTSIKDQTKEVNTSIDSIKIEATDNSGQAVTNKVSGLPTGVTFDSETNTISGTPTKVGSYPITVTTTDSSGNETKTSFIIEVVDTTSPVVTSIADQTKEVNTSIDSIKIEATDNSGEAVTNKVSGLPDGVSFDSETNTISGTPTKVGNYPITVTTTDASGNEMTTKFTIKVVDTISPVVTSITDQTKEVNTAIDSIKIEATDNSGQDVTNKVSGLPSGVSFNSETNTISGTPTKVGNYPITVTTTDASGNKTETKFTIEVVDKTAPTVTSIANQTKEVNTPIDSITVEATDNSGQAVTNKVSGLPSGVSFDGETNTISGTPTKVGNYPITVTTTDAEGNATTTKFTIQVVDTIKPMVTSIEDQTKEVNTAIDSITIEATDNSGQAVTNKVSGLPEGVSFDSATNTISGTPTKVGSYPITVTTTDAEGNETTTKFTIQVVDTTKPTVTVIKDQTKEVNTAIDSITIEATDNSGQAVTNKVSGLPAGVEFDSETNTISGTPTKVGSYPIVVTTTDAEGNETTSNFTIKIVDTTKPTVTSIANQTKEVNTPIDSIKIEAKDNSGQKVTNKISGLPEGVSFDSETNTISGTPTKVGSYPITVTTTDASDNETTTNFTIKVVDTTLPVVTSITNQSKEVNTPIDKIAIEATDNSGQSVINKVSGLPTGVTFDSETNTISGTPTKVGSYPIVVTTTDASGNETTTSFTIKVADTTKPTVTAIKDQTKEVNTPIDSIKIEATDNSGQTVTNKVIGLPEGVSFDSETNTISGTPTKVGSYPITVTTTDASGNETTTKFTIKVVDTTKPTVTSIGNQTKEVNTPIDSITIDATDNSGQAMTNKVSGLPNGVSFDSATNTITGTPTKVGSYPITITTTDAEGNATTTNFTIKVVDTTPPVVKSIANQTIEVDTAMDTITIEASDNSGQAVTNKVSGLPDGVIYNSQTNAISFAPRMHSSNLVKMKAMSIANNKTGTISGIPTKIGTYPITVTTTDAEGNETITQFIIKVVDTTAPVVTPIKNQTKEINTILDPIKVEATDNSGQSVTNKISGLPEGVSFDSATNTITGTPTKVGSYPITVTTTDASGNETTSNFTIKIVDTTKPTVTSIANQTKEVNTPIDSIKIEAKDNSGQKVTNKVSGLPESVSFDSETNIISGTPTKVGSYPITVTTIDAEGNETTTNFTIKVVDTTKPTVTSIANQTKEVNTAINSIKIEATDNSGQIVTNKVSGLPAGVIFDSETNTISGTPTKVGSYPITVTTTDAEGNETTTKFTVEVVDTTKPTVTSIKDQSKEVNTSIDPIKIEATDNSGQAVTNKISGLPEGVSFDSATNTISGTPTKVGSYPITLITTDAEGNETTTNFIIKVVDTTAPPAPAINPIKEGAKEIGGKAEPGSTVVITFPDGQTAEGKADTDGNYRIEVPTDEHLKGGDHISVTSTDTSGNTSKATIITVIDTTAPPAPTINPIKEGAKEISGKAEPGSTVVITFPDGQTAEGQVDSDGNYHIVVPTNEHLKGGDHISVTSTDTSGNTSKATIITVIDTTAPKAPTINPIKEGAKEISGKAEPGSTVIITFPDGQTAEGKADSDGNYHIEVPTDEHLKGGDHISVTATDTSGNTSKATIITVIDTTAPPAPTINPIKEGAKEISGKAEPGSTVVITFPDGQTAEGKADSDGNYHIEVPTDEHLKGGDHISVTATDTSGNISKPSDVIVEGIHKHGKGDKPDDSNHHNGNNAKPDNPNHHDGVNPEPNKHNNSKGSNNHHVEKPSHNEHVNHPDKSQSNNDDNQTNGNQSKPSYTHHNEHQKINGATNTSNNQEEQPIQSQRDHSKANYGKNNSETDLPETGEEKGSKGILFGSLFAGLGALLLLFKRRRKDEDNNEKE